MINEKSFNNFYDDFNDFSYSEHLSKTNQKEKIYTSKIKNDKEESETSKIKNNIKFLELIDKGGFSKVYKAELIYKKKTIAVKVLDKVKKVDRNEMKISEKLKNKNINDIYCSYKDEKTGEYNIIMEYSKLGNLKNFQLKFLEKNYLSETLLCFICYQILNGLKYIHQCKIVHLDIKPQNILIDEYLNVKIIDFSISLDYSKNKSKQIKLPIIGTSFYMAPEILNSDFIFIKDLNKVDLFSLGVILFNMAFGYYPFGLEKEDVKNYKIIYEKIMKNNLEFDNDDDYYSSYFIDFLKLLLEKDIKKRINIYEALNNYWVKGAEILLEEKENLFNAEKFLGYLVTDHIKNFDDYISRKNIVENEEKNDISESKKNLVEGEAKNSILESKKNLIEKEKKIFNSGSKNNFVKIEKKNSISEDKKNLIEDEANISISKNKKILIGDEIKNSFLKDEKNFDEEENNILFFDYKNDLFQEEPNLASSEEYRDFIESKLINIDNKETISENEVKKYDNIKNHKYKDFFQSPL